MNAAGRRKPQDSPVIRDYRPEDRPGVVTVIRSVYNDYNYIMDFETFDSDLADIPSTYQDSGGAFWVLEADRAVAGTIGVIPKDAVKCELRRLYLGRAYRGRGWGRMLVQTVVDWAESHGYPRIVLWSDVLFERAHHLYVQSGFKPTEKTRAIDPNNPTSVERYFIREKGQTDPL
jgi:putative acetyltransferase